MQVLFDVSFTVEAGKIVSVVGSNAAGKTTIIRTISGMNPVASGQIEFMGEDVTNLPSSRLVELGIVQISEGRNLFPGMTVHENLEMGAFTRKAGLQMRTSLERVYGLFPLLFERRKQMAGTLSGGEQQMVAIGRGLMSLPKLMMFDEPSHGLAPIMVEKMFEIVKEINREGTTVLMVEQNVFHALSIASKGYIIENGRVVFEGSGPELLKDDRVRQAYLGI
ncbi:MAG: ABC transporter ATP-binding protein [Hyphomicrobiales bacterium]|nr:ABC transporter ATP-binding protein [Hyphomicrobiales bacterium]